MSEVFDVEKEEKKRHPFYKNWVEGIFDDKPALFYPKFNNPWMFQCKLCKKGGRIAWFSTREKLREHFKVCH